MSPPEGFTEDWLVQHQRRLQKRATGTLGPFPAPSRQLRSQRPRKYKNIPTLVTFRELEVVHGHHRMCHTFDSQKEADYYQALALRRQAGEITDLRLQEPFALIVRGLDGPVVVGEWLADAVFYECPSGVRVVADVKSEGTRTAVYQLKKKIVEACWGISILEV